MNRKVTQVLLSISLASFISCAPSIKSTLERTKRSYYPGPAHKLLSHLWLPRKLRHDQHETLKRSGLSLDFIDSLLNDPMFADEEEPLGEGDSLLHEAQFNEPNNQESMLADALKPEKDPMSNVIPGAQGPYHTPKENKPTAHQQQITDELMDDFLMFLSLKDLGMLDMCFGDKRR